MSAGYRLAWYLALTVVLLYVGNLSERELPTRRICRWLSALFIVTVAGGYLGIIAPHFQFTSASEHLVPAGVAHNSFFVSRLCMLTGLSLRKFTSTTPDDPVTLKKIRRALATLLRADQIEEVKHLFKDV